MRWRLIAILPFAVAIAIGNTIERVHVLGARISHVVERTIIKREQHRRRGGIPIIDTSQEPREFGHDRQTAGTRVYIARG